METIIITCIIVSTIIYLFERFIYVFYRKNVTEPIEKYINEDKKMKDEESEQQTPMKVPNMDELSAILDDFEDGEFDKE